MCRCSDQGFISTIGFNECSGDVSPPNRRPLITSCEPREPSYPSKQVRRTILHAFESAETKASRFGRSRWANPTRCLLPVTTTPITEIFKPSSTHRSVMKLLVRILDKTVGLPQTSKTGSWSGSIFLQGKHCWMLLVEQEARRCASPRPPVVLSSALTFMNRQLRRRLRWQPSTACPSAPNFGLQTLPGRYHSLTPAST